MIETMAVKVATHIKRVVPEHPASLPRLIFSLSIIINLLLIVLLTLVISIATGNTSSACVAMLSFAILRQATGGKHLKSGMACVLASTLLLTGLSYVSFGDGWIVALTLISVTLIIIFAPSGIKEQSRIPKRHYGKLKWGSATVVLLSMFFMSPTLTAACFAQCLTLISFSKGGEKIAKENV